MILNLKKCGNNFYYFFILFIFMRILKWGLGIGDWGLGIGDWGLGIFLHCFILYNYDVI